jgi:DNA polymerase-3 subunit epsilon
MSILDRAIAAAPYAVIDVETTGLSPRHDRIVEIAIVLVLPGEEPKLALDTLVNPERGVGATDIHGIADEHVAGAPRFAEIAPFVVALLANRVPVAHNALFDLAFVNEELARAGFAPAVPHLCTMGLGRVLDPSASARSLRRAAEHHGIPAHDAHAASADASVAARVLRFQLGALRAAGIQTFDQLHAKSVGRYEFVRSFGEALLPAPPVVLQSRDLSPRAGKKMRPTRMGLAQYLDALAAAVGDLHLSGEEQAELLSLPARLRLSEDEVRAAHARIFWAMLSRYIEDSRVDEIEAAHLATLHALLSRLGWAPGT